MGKKARTARAKKRMAEKRSRKDAMQRQYAAWAAEGRNSKSKRAQKRSKEEGKKRIRVRDPNSRNTGDVTQFPRLNMPFLAKMWLQKSAGYPHSYTGKHTQMVRDFCKTNGLTWNQGLRQHGRPLGEEHLQHLVDATF